MRPSLIMFLLTVAASSQTATFEVASVKENARRVGPDYNNQFAVSFSRFAGRNATLRRLIADAHGVQLTQVIGPRWLDESEYDIDARAAGDLSPDRLRSMLLTLLVDRFRLKEHMEQRTMRGIRAGH